MGFNNEKNSTLRKAALIAGLGLFIMTPAAVFADYARKSLIVAGSVNSSSELVFRAGIFAYFLVLLLDVIVAFALYYFLRPINKKLSLIAGVFRVIYTVVFGISLFRLVGILGMLKTPGTATNQIIGSLNVFQNGWNFALIIFGLHLGLVGYLVLKSNYVPKWLGILLVIAGLGYFIDSIGRLFIPGYNITISMVTFVGELLLMIWLLVKGRKVTDQAKV